MRKRLIRRSAAEPTPPGENAPPVRPGARDRRGRGLRGPLAPPESPLSRTRAEAFEDLVEDSISRLEVRFSRELASVEFAIAAVPTISPEDVDGIPLTRLYRGGAGRNARIVLYRRAIEARAGNRADLAVLIQDLLVEQVADLLDKEPEDIDPDYGLD